MLRWLLMLAGASLVAADWSGTIEVSATFSGTGTRTEEVERQAHALEQRLTALRAEARQAPAPEARLLHQDIGDLEGELEALALDQGGTVTTGSSRYYVLDAARVMVDGDEGRVVVDRVRGTARVMCASGAQPVKPAPVPAAVEPANTSDGDPAFGLPTRRAELVIDNSPVLLVWVPGLPNVYALTRIESQMRSSLHRVLAELPGLPVAVERRHQGGILRWTVTQVQAGAVDPQPFVE